MLWTDHTPLEIIIVIVIVITAYFSTADRKMVKFDVSPEGRERTLSFSSDARSGIDNSLSYVSEREPSTSTWPMSPSKCFISLSPNEQVMTERYLL